MAKNKWKNEKKKTQPHNRKAPTLLFFRKIQVEILKTNHFTEKGG